jgi:hypothetical protein
MGLKVRRTWIELRLQNGHGQQAPKIAMNSNEQRVIVALLPPLGDRKKDA